LAEEAVTMVARVLHVELCSVLELKPEGDSFLLRAGTGWPEGLVGAQTFAAGAQSHSGYTLDVASPVLVEDLRNETRFRPPPLLLELGAISGLSAPIGRPGNPYGVITAHSREKREFSTSDVNFLEAIANLIATAVERRIYFE